MRIRTGRAGVALLAAVAAGCASANSRFYTLTATAPAADGPAVPVAVTVGPVSLPAAVDRPQLVVQAAPNRLQLDEFNRWAAPLDDTVARAVAQNLETLLGSNRVVAGPMANFGPAYRVTLDVQQFETVPGQGVLIDAVWAVHGPAGGTARVGRTVAREDVGDARDYDALAAAHSRALATISADVAAAVRAQAAADAAEPHRLAPTGKTGRLRRE
jgi:uncharacterized lipoprotein YmbA